MQHKSIAAVAAVAVAAEVAVLVMVHAGFSAYEHGADELGAILRVRVDVDEHGVEPQRGVG